MSRSSTTTTTTASSGGIGFAGLLTILFIGLKLTGYIDWSWWWVLSPLWISFLAFIFVTLVILIVMVFIAILKN